MENLDAYLIDFPKVNRRINKEQVPALVDEIVPIFEEVAAITARTRYIRLVGEFLHLMAPKFSGVSRVPEPMGSRRSAWEHLLKLNFAALGSLNEPVSSRPETVGQKWSYLLGSAKGVYELSRLLSDNPNLNKEHYEDFLEKEPQQHFEAFSEWRKGALEKSPIEYNSKVEEGIADPKHKPMLSNDAPKNNSGTALTCLVYLLYGEIFDYIGNQKVIYDFLLLAYPSCLVKDTKEGSPLSIAPDSTTKALIDEVGFRKRWARIFRT